MTLPGFTAEVSLHKTGERYQGRTATPAHGESVTPAHHIGRPPTCYINGSEADCDFAFGCLAIGACYIDYFPIAVRSGAYDLRSR